MFYAFKINLKIDQCKIPQAVHVCYPWSVCHLMSTACHLQKFYRINEEDVFPPFVLALFCCGLKHRDITSEVKKKKMNKTTGSFLAWKPANKTVTSQLCGGQLRKEKSALLAKAVRTEPRALNDCMALAKLLSIEKKHRLLWPVSLTLTWWINTVFECKYVSYLRTLGSNEMPCSLIINFL